MNLIIAEKPSVAVSYAKALNVTARKSGYFEGNGYIITWCIGHLAGLANAESYSENYKKWSLADLPIIPDNWQYVISEGKNKQFEVVKKLMNDKRVTEVINACDAGREGELIFRLVYEKAGCTKPIKRLWISSMEEKAIVEGFNNLRDGADYDSLYQSALCRSKADWLIGINATRLFTKLYNKKLNVGRVQTPTLAMLAERGAKISGFVKEKYYNVKLNDIAVSEKFTEQAEAENVKTSCNGQKAVVTSVKREKKTVNPPKLYDLTSLQREANRLYGFTAQQSLDYAQSLYEMRCITYPRTDSRYLTEDMSDTVKAVITALIDNLPEFEGIAGFKGNLNRVIYNVKVTDHHAIIPTAEVATAKLDELPDGERKILLLIANKLLCATSDKQEYEAVTAVIECGGNSFTAKGKTVISDGWKSIERLIKGDSKDETDEAEETTLDLTEGQSLENTVCAIAEQYTKPPKAFTEDTLLSAMERAAIEETAENTERCGLGTPATRAGIIEKLIKSGFVRREKKSLVVTAEGAELISLMPDVLKSAQLTADWENGLAQIADGTLDPVKFMSEIEELTRAVITEGKSNVNPDKVAKYEPKGAAIGKCPRCQANVHETPKAYSCACGFTLWKNNKFFENAKKPFTKEIAAALLKDGKVALDGLYSQKTSKTYSAVVCLEDKGKYINFKLEFPKKA